VLILTLKHVLLRNIYIIMQKKMTLNIVRIFETLTAFFSNRLFARIHLLPSAAALQLLITSHS